MKMSRVFGVIAEDKSDVAVIREILSMYFESQSFSLKHYAKGGCGKVKRKCSSWAKNLHMRGCQIIIIVHDRDKNNVNYLQKDLKNRIEAANIDNYLIVIPIQEIEAWLLADPGALMAAFNLRERPKIVADTESIDSPKYYLRKLMRSRYNKIYIHTTHNAKIASHMNIENLRKCQSFKVLDEYLSSL